MSDRELSNRYSDSPLRVVAAVVFDGDTVFVCRRNPEKSAGGLWEFPGGKIEPGETPEAALLREIREELDAEIIIEGELYSGTTQVDETMVELTCYQARFSGARPVRSTDHDQLLWSPISDLEQLEWTAPDRPVVQKIRS